MFTETKKNNKVSTNYTDGVSKRYTIPKTKDALIAKALNAFLNTNETKARFGNYFIDGHELYYRAVCSGELEQDLIAMHTSNGPIGNSSALGLIGRRVSFGRERLNRNVTEVQQVLGVLIPMIPFTVFEQAELDLNTFNVLDRGPEEKIVVKVDTGKYEKDTDKKIFIEETRHFTGASLFTVGDALFLFDVDRNEIKHKIFNPFLVKLPFVVDSIAAAYEALKPVEVKNAEKVGKQVKRQGEWWFIPLSAKEAKGLHHDVHTRQNSWNRAGSARKLELRAGNNRPNRAQYGVAKLSYVKGRITHSGREHKDLILKGWCKALPNTAVESFTITGDID